MNMSALRFFTGLVLLVATAATSRAQLLLTIDVSNVSAVKITATGTAPAYSYNNGAGDTPVYGGGASSFKGEDGITLVGFLTADSLYTGNVGPGASSSTLTDYSGNSTFDQFYVISGHLRDLNIFANNTSSDLVFANGHAAFTGEAVFDLSAGDWADLVSRLPTYPAGGNIVLYNEFSFALGTWSVTSAVPEPSTYAAIFGGIALVGVVLRRRRAARG